jgi:hypothetical protein
LGEDLRGAGRDHADLVQTQRVEPQRVFRVELAPARVRQLGQCLQRVIVSLCDPPIDQLSRDPFRLCRADIAGFENGPQDALGGNGMIADELLVS